MATNSEWVMVATRENTQVMTFMYSTVHERGICDDTTDDENIFRDLGMDKIQRLERNQTKRARCDLATILRFDGQSNIDGIEGRCGESEADWPGKGDNEADPASVHHYRALEATRLMKSKASCKKGRLESATYLLKRYVDAVCRLLSCLMEDALGTCSVWLTLRTSRLVVLIPFSKSRSRSMAMNST